MFQLIRDFVVLKELPVWPGDGWEKGTSNGSWENQASGFRDYTLAPAMPDGYMLTPTCACQPECSPRACVLSDRAMPPPAQHRCHVQVTAEGLALPRLQQRVRLRCADPCHVG